MILLQHLFYIATLLSPHPFKIYLRAGDPGYRSTWHRFHVHARYEALQHRDRDSPVHSHRFIPCISLIVLWRMSEKATKSLREAGFHVGFLGASLSQFRRNS